MLTVDEIKSYIIPVIEKYPIKRVILFGSYARGDANDNSDVDLIVDSGGELMKGTLIFRLGGQLMSALPIGVDVYDMEEIKNVQLKKNIVKDGKMIYERKNKT